MQTLLNLPETLGEELARFRDEVERFKSGVISATEFRSFRVPHGVYEQREEGTYMLRVRLPAGAILPCQMRAIADVSREFANGVLHLTTRQDIQVHRVPLDKVHPALVRLFEAGLSTKGGGGNTVRNVTACPHAGVCEREVFDVSPYVVGVSEFLLADPASYRLPRKYKMAFSGCSNDCSAAMVSDLGFVAARRNGEEGFAVYVGGGMGARSRVADRLEEFVHPSQVHLVAEAVKRVFDTHGNRKNKHRARLRFLVEQIGIVRFRELYEGELRKLRGAGLPELRLRNLRGETRPVVGAGPSSLEHFDRWCLKCVFRQKQKEYYTIEIPIVLGDIEAGNLERLADVAEEHGEGMVRATQDQNLVLRWVHENELAQVCQKLVSAELACTEAPVIHRLVACAGASTCKLGVCLSRGLARAIITELHRSGLALDRLGNLRIHISGCPNACGRHPIAQIGLFGAARRVGGRLVPHYILQLGGRIGQGTTRLAEGKESLPARSVPAFVAEFLRAFEQSPELPDFEAFLEARGRQVAAELFTKYQHVPPFEEDKNYYYDWGAEVPFSLAGRGPGECGAGVLDLIELDLAGARAALARGDLHTATVLAARALLITQGHEARTDAEALTLFTRYFLDTGLVPQESRRLIEAARQRALAPANQFEPYQGEVESLVRTVETLFANMDQALKFRTAACGCAASTACGVRSSPAKPLEVEASSCTLAHVDKEADLREAACPLNYVKTSLLLEQMNRGEVLSVLLSEEGARNVPASAELDGHKVLSVKKEGGQWRLLIQKQ